MKIVILISAITNSWCGQQGKSVWLFVDNRLSGGWIDAGFDHAAEVLKASFNPATTTVRFDQSCEKESRDLWESVKVFDASKFP